MHALVRHRAADEAEPERAVERRGRGASGADSAPDPPHGLGLLLEDDDPAGVVAVLGVELRHSGRDREMTVDRAREDLAPDRGADRVGRSAAQLPPFAAQGERSSLKRYMRGQIGQ